MSDTSHLFLNTRSKTNKNIRDIFICKPTVCSLLKALFS